MTPATHCEDCGYCLEDLTAFQQRRIIHTQQDDAGEEHWAWCSLDHLEAWATRPHPHEGEYERLDAACSAWVWWTRSCLTTHPGDTLRMIRVVQEISRCAAGEAEQEIEMEAQR